MIYRPAANVVTFAWLCSYEMAIQITVEGIQGRVSQVKSH
jgi:hypothetical protein